jgi:phosphomannomutase/phosphoglucomutase
LIKQSIFREFSIRGEAERDLPDSVASQIGRAIGTYFAPAVFAEASATLVVGHDVRVSSPRISQALVAGLVSTGATVLDIGLAPTPTLNFAVDHFQANGGVMVTASHNPPQDNGFKLRADVTLTGETLQQIYILATKQTFVNGAGIRRSEEGLTPYLVALKARVLPGRAKNVVVDGGNGVNGRVVSRFLRGLGHHVIELFTEPDGAFPNRNPDPTGPDALVAAGEAVINQGADFGLAYDGDGDRLALLDELGRPYYGDIVLMLLARHALQSGPVQVVHDVSCTKALADDVVAHGGQAHPAAVGYAFVHEKMRQLGATLGGESSGHIFCLDDAFRFDDAILASVKLLNYFGQSNDSVSALIDDLPRYHTSPNLRIFCPDTLKGRVVEAVITHYQGTHLIDTTDGAKITFDRGWALVRQSNTQPAISLRVEGETLDRLPEIQNEVVPLVRGELAKLGIQPDNGA